MGHEALLEIRKSDNVKLKPLKHLRSKIKDPFGNEIDLKIRNYQAQAILHLAVMPRFVEGDDTGLGKTLIAIAGFCTILESKPNAKGVILTTKSAVAQWGEDGFDKFTHGIQTFICKGTPVQREKVRKAYLAFDGPSVLILGYRSFVQDFTEYQNVKFDCAILDEAAIFKNEKSRVHQCVEHLSRNSEKVWALTATLIKNQLIEGHGIYKVVVPGLFKSRNKFVEEFAITRMQRVGNRQVPIITGYHKSKVAEFRTIIEPYFLSRAKFEVAKELPVLEKRIVKLPMSKAQEDLYAEALSGIFTTKVGEEKKVTKLTSLIYCQQIVNHPELVNREGDSEKLNWVLDNLADEEGDLYGQKVIIYTRFTGMIDILAKSLADRGIKTVQITGAGKEDQRNAAKVAFQDPNSGVNVILITSAASEAVNLQMANALVFYDAPWSAGELLQILGRMIRIGSVHDKCYSIFLTSTLGKKKTIDGHVLDVLNKKLQLIEDVIGKRIKGDSDGVDETLTGESTLDELFGLLAEGL